MIPVDDATMRAIAPKFSGALAASQSRIIAAVGGVLAPTLERFKIDTRLRIAHFLAQTCHESAGFRTTVEFASGAAYEGRADLGNTQKGDGKKFKGRGLLQLTGRANYTEYGKSLALDLVDHPEIAAEPATSLLIACEYWRRRKINPDCDRDDLVAVTKKVNGGKNGLKDRSGFLVKAKAAIARIQGAAIGATATDGNPVLHRGSENDAVEELQHLLQDAGFALAIDGDFGAATELAVTHFQQQKGLNADGIVGPETWAALRKAAPGSGE